MRNFKELYSERVRYFLHTLRKKKPAVYIVVWSRPRSQEYKGFPFREEVELSHRDLWDISHIGKMKIEQYGLGAWCARYFYIRTQMWRSRKDTQDPLACPFVHRRDPFAQYGTCICPLSASTSTQPLGASIVLLFYLGLQLLLVQGTRIQTDLFRDRWLIQPIIRVVYTIQTGPKVKDPFSIPKISLLLNYISICHLVFCKSNMSKILINSFLKCLFVPHIRSTLEDCDFHAMYYDPTLSYSTQYFSYREEFKYILLSTFHIGKNLNVCFILSIFFQSI